jgi:hypothetical protein
VGKTRYPAIGYKAVVTGAQILKLPNVSHLRACQSALEYLSGGASEAFHNRSVDLDKRTNFSFAAQDLA